MTKDYSLLGMTRPADLESSKVKDETAGDHDIVLVALASIYIEGQCAGPEIARR